MSYDTADRNTAITSGGKQTTYTRDAQDRIIAREHKENGSTTSTVAYSFTGSGDTPDALLDSNGSVKQKYVTLPGDVLMTIKTDSQSAGATTYSLPNLHGDIFATVDADGALQNTFMTGPFGEVLPNQPAQPTTATTAQANPSNTTEGTTYSYVGQHQKLTDIETSPIVGGIIQMGARPYLPALGRFLSVDPVEEGTDNSYAYTNDAVNEFDLDGKAVNWKSVIKSSTKIASYASMIPGPIGMIAAGVSVAGNIAMGNYAGAAVAAIGFIPGGRLVSGVASKSKLGSKFLSKTMTIQSRAPIIGAKSYLFGNATYRKSPSLLNRAGFKAGWASNPNTGRLGFRYKLPFVRNNNRNHVWMGNTSRVAIKFPNYKQAKKIRVRN